ncbi:MAG: hypothetical protein ACRDSK_19480 [Actinophytocola sp.]|uniref:hypothetical protein n=1 Tax=Actinophytocola sp. TaxID=1872138 RepID=UPI003D6B589C
MNPEDLADEADVLEQRRELGDEPESVVTPNVDVEADPADLQEQNMPVPSEEEDRPDA